MINLILVSLQCNRGGYNTVKKKSAAVWNRKLYKYSTDEWSAMRSLKFKKSRIKNLRFSS
jgi:hypothetical protein